MMRWVRRIPAVLSAAVLVGVAVFWPRSYWRGDVVLARLPGGMVQGAATCGGRVFLVLTPNREEQTGLVIDHTSAPAAILLAVHERSLNQFAVNQGRWGFFYRRSVAGEFGEGGVVLLEWPIWLLIVPASFLPLLSLKRKRTIRRRRKRGLCLACGYDLRATPERCPECGKKVGVVRRSDEEMGQGGEGIGRRLVVATAAALAVAGGYLGMTHARSDPAAMLGTLPPEALARRVAVDVHGERFSETIEQLGRRAGVPIHLAPSLESGEQKIEIHLRDVPLGEALHLVARAFDIKMSVSSGDQGEVVLHDKWFAQSNIWRRYDLSDLAFTAPGPVSAFGPPLGPRPPVPGRAIWGTPFGARLGTTRYSAFDRPMDAADLVGQLFANGYYERLGTWVFIWETPEEHARFQKKLAVIRTWIHQGFLPGQVQAQAAAQDLTRHKEPKR